MKTIIKSIAIVLLLANTAFAQKYMTKNGHISFYSKAPLEDIEAHNRQVSAALDTETGNLVFKVLIKSFQFEKALMQEHFNENYMESGKFPTSVFQGNVTNHEDIDFASPGNYKAEITGNLTIHGITREINTTGTFIVDEKQIKGDSEFMVRLDDYDIEIPKAVINNIAEEIKITVDILLKPLKNTTKK